MTSSLEGEGGGHTGRGGGVSQKMTCDVMMTRGAGWGGGGKGLMTKYPLFTEILAKPMILNTFQGSYQT